MYKVVLIVALLAYIQTLFHDFTYDDQFAIINNDDVRGASKVKELLHHDFWGQAMESPMSNKSFRPVTVLAFRIQHTIARELSIPSQYVHHGINILLHGCVTVLVYAIAKDWNDNEDTALLSALLFAVHPIHTEAVASIVGQAELLSALFSLSAFRLYTSIGGSTHVLGVVLLIWLGAFAKEIGITIVGTMALSDVCRNKVSMNRLLFRFLALFLAFAVYIDTRRAVSGGNQLLTLIRKIENPLPFAPTALSRFLSLIYLHYKYTEQLLLGYELSADWSYSCVEYVESMKDLRAWAAISLYVLVTICLVSLIVFKDNRRIFMFVGLMLTPFAPASNVFFYVGTFIGERLLYMPSIGYCMLLADAVHKRNRRWIFWCIMGYYTARTLRRNVDWKSDYTLFKAAENVCPKSAKAQLNVGILERRLGNWDVALKHFEQAQTIEETYCEPIYQKALTLLSRDHGRPSTDVFTLLEESLACKYVSAKALELLNQLYNKDIQNASLPLTDRVNIELKWASVLSKPGLKRYRDAAVLCEHAMILLSSKREVEQSAIMSCYDILLSTASESPGPTPDYPLLGHIDKQELDTLKSCLRGREPLIRSMRSPTKQAWYPYITQHAKRCREVYGGADTSKTLGVQIHSQIILAAQSIDPEDPWLQLEWAEILVQTGRASESLVHFMAAAMLLNQELHNSLHNRPVKTLSLKTMQPIEPEEAYKGILEAYRIAARAEKLSATNDEKQTVFLCGIKKGECKAHSTIAAAGSDEDKLHQEREYFECMAELREMTCPS